MLSRYSSLHLATAQRVRPWCARLCVLAIVVGLQAGRTHAQPQPNDSQDVVEGRIYNVSDRPFEYQLRRSRGTAWTPVFRLEPGQYHAYRGPLYGGRADLAGLLTRPSRLRDGYLIVQFPEYGGLRRFRIRATDLQGRIAPFWFFVTDSAGHGHLVQARSVERARIIQEELRKQPAPSSEELAVLKRVLRANHVLHLPE